MLSSDATRPDALACQRERFDIPAGVTYLNCAAMCPLPQASYDAGVRRLATRARPWTIKHPEADYEDADGARRRFARLVGAQPSDIAIVAASSYGVAVAAANLPVASGQTIVMPAAQHQSNVLHWDVIAGQAGAAVVRVPRPARGDWTEPLRAAIDGRTAIVAVPTCDWSDGLRVDLVAVGRRARAVGAALVVDGTQSIGAVPFDVREVQPDFVVCSTHKWLLGPSNMAFLYAAPRWQEGRPIEHHGLNRLNFLEPGRHEQGGEVSAAFLPGAERFDVGQRNNLVQLAIANASLDVIDAWGVEAIGRTILPLTAEVAARGRGLGLMAPEAGSGVDHFVGLRFASAVPAGLGRLLAAENVFVAVRGGVLRVSPHVYNNATDIERAFAVLERCI